MAQYSFVSAWPSLSRNTKVPSSGHKTVRLTWARRPSKRPSVLRATAAAGLHTTGTLHRRRDKRAPNGVVEQFSLRLRPLPGELPSRPARLPAPPWHEPWLASCPWPPKAQFQKWHAQFMSCAGSACRMAPAHRRPAWTCGSTAASRASKPPRCRRPPSGRTHAPRPCCLMMMAERFSLLSYLFLADSCLVPLFRRDWRPPQPQKLREEIWVVLTCRRLLLVGRHCASLAARLVMARLRAI